MNKQKKVEKYLTGKVVSMGTEKTVIVSVIHEFRHPLYKKAVKRLERFAVHNENPEIVLGDMVKIEETRPISKTKHFKLIGKIGKLG